MSRTYSVLLAEPNSLLREKMAGVLTRSRTFWSVILVEGRGNLARATAQAQPDFILADLIVLKDPELQKYLRRTSADSRIIALVDSKLEPYMEAARELGLDGIVERGRAGEEIRIIVGSTEDTNEATD